MPARFLLSIFLGAFLLFQVQPMIGRYVLPWFGGGPTVWTNCMLFFQVLLVGGYAYAHWLGSRRNTRFQAAVHTCLLAASLLFLPLSPGGILARQASSNDPSGRILLVLAVSIGGPYLMLSATSPLLQRWFSISEPGRSPWRLYSLSNLGSFLALLTYPFAVEPFFTLKTQSWAWSALYVIFALLCVWTAWTMRPADHVPAGIETGWPGWRIVFYWAALAMCGSILLLATTNLICQEVAVIPFLWVAPLSIYLLTFVLAFDDRGWYRPTLFAVLAGVLAPAGCAVMAAAVAISPWSQLLVYLLALFVTCMVCHGELARSRPSPAHLTAFYLAIAIGGALGGIFVALVCPHIFTQFTEYPLGLTLACILGLLGWVSRGALSRWKSGALAVRIPVMALLIGAMTGFVTAFDAGATQPALASSRNFYGILRVTEYNDPRNGPFRELTHGRTRHGFEYLNYPQRTWPTAYYGPHSGAGIALQQLDRQPRRVGVIGLGAGTLAAWGRPGDVFRFYEINPDVVRVANQWFSYLKDSKAQVEIVLGDARVELQRELARGEAQQFDFLAVDAFSSDAIPLHLLTAECGDLYRKHMAPGGVLAFHISNRLLRLDPVTRGLAQHLGWNAGLFVSAPNEATGEILSRWVLLTDNAGFFEKRAVADALDQWGKNQPAPITWTDDFASLWHVLKF